MKIEAKGSKSGSSVSLVIMTYDNLIGTCNVTLDIFSTVFVPVATLTTAVLLAVLHQGDQMVSIQNRSVIQERRRRRKRAKYSVSTIAWCGIIVFLACVWFYEHGGQDRLKTGSKRQDPPNGTRGAVVGLQTRTNHRIVKDLPDHCLSSSYPDFKEIIIKGERHSGTNWIRSMLQHNVKEGIEVSQESMELGWKHGFLPPNGWGRPLTENDLLLVITRDIFTWLPKMAKQAYDDGMDKKRQLGFSRFIRTDYSALCHPQRKEMMGKPQSDYQMKFCTALSIEGTNSIDHEEDNIAETAENLIQIRTQKYKQWLSEDLHRDTFVGSKETILQNRIHLRLESITEPEVLDNELDSKARVNSRQERAVGVQLLDHCVPMYEDFQEVTEHTSWRVYQSANKFNSEEEQELLLNRYTKEDLRFVLSQLDMEFERKLGYNYDYILERLEKDDSFFRQNKKSVGHHQGHHREHPLGPRKPKMRLRPPTSN